MSGRLAGVLVVCTLAGMSGITAGTEVEAEPSARAQAEQARMLVARMGSAGGAERQAAGKQLAGLLRGREKLLFSEYGEALRGVSGFEARMAVKEVLRPASARCIERTLAALDRKITFEFVQAPLGECLDYLSMETGVAIRLASDSGDKDRLITLKMTGHSVLLALYWISMLARFEATLDPDGSVVLSDKDQNADRLTLAVPWPFGNCAPEREGQVRQGLAMMVERIPRAVAPESWGPGRGTIRSSGTQGLIVLQTGRVQAQLDELWKACGPDWEEKESADRSGAIAAARGWLDRHEAEVAAERERMRAVGTELAAASEPKAATWLVAAVNDPDWEVRREAAVRLGRCRAAAAVRLLFRATGDCAPEVREAASGAIRGLEGEHALDPLAEVLVRGETPARVLALQALGRVGGARAEAALAEALADRAEEIRAQAVRSLGGMASPRAVTLVLGLATDRDESVRMAVRSAIGALRESWALDPLLAALNSPDPEARSLAAGALGNVGGVRAEEGLAAALGNADPRVRATAARPLAEFRSARSVELLLRVAALDGDEAVRDLARSALRASLGPWSLPALRQSAGNVADAHWQVRCEAVEALGALESREAADALVELLRDADRRVRLAAGRALARFTEDWGLRLRAGAFAPLVAQLGDQAWARRHAAARELAAVGAVAAPALRAAVSQSRDCEVVSRAEELLLDVDPDFVAERLLKSRQPGERLEGAVRLGGMGPAGAPAVPALVAALKDVDEGVRVAAVNALAAIGDGQATTPLMGLASSGKGSDQERAAVALALSALQKGTGSGDRR